MLLIGSIFAAPAPPIVGGAEDAEHPEVLLLLLADGAGQPQGVCSGVRLSATQVLSAAHCLDDSVGPAPAAVWLVQAPDLDSASAADTWPVAGWTLHPEADPETGAHDLALLRTETAAEGPFAAVDATILGDAHLDRPLRLVGYGATDELDGNDNPTRRSVEVPLYDLDRELLYTWTEGRNACHGDSGGPVFRVRDDGAVGLVGVISYISGCDGGGTGAPRITRDLDWLGEHAELQLLEAETPADTGEPADPEGCGCGHGGAAGGVGVAAAVSGAWWRRRELRGPGRQPPVALRPTAAGATHLGAPHQR